MLVWMMAALSELMPPISRVVLSRLSPSTNASSHPTLIAKSATSHEPERRRHQPNINSARPITSYRSSDTTPASGWAPFWSSCTDSTSRSIVDSLPLLFQVIRYNPGGSTKVADFDHLHTSELSLIEDVYPDVATYFRASVNAVARLCYRIPRGASPQDRDIGCGHRARAKPASGSDVRPGVRDTQLRIRSSTR